MPFTRKPPVRRPGTIRSLVIATGAAMAITCATLAIDPITVAMAWHSTQNCPQGNSECPTTESATVVERTTQVDDIVGTILTRRTLTWERTDGTTQHRTVGLALYASTATDTTVDLTIWRSRVVAISAGTAAESFAPVRAVLLGALGGGLWLGIGIAAWGGRRGWRQGWATVTYQGVCWLLAGSVPIAVGAVRLTHGGPSGYGWIWEVVAAATTALVGLGLLRIGPPPEPPTPADDPELLGALPGQRPAPWLPDGPYPPAAASILPVARTRRLGGLSTATLPVPVLQRMARPDEAAATGADSPQGAPAAAAPGPDHGDDPALDGDPALDRDLDQDEAPDPGEGTAPVADPGVTDGDPAPVTAEPALAAVPEQPDRRPPGPGAGAEGPSAGDAQPPPADDTPHGGRDPVP